VINGKPGHYAEELANNKFNLIFLTDEADKMTKHAKHLEATHSIQTAVVKMNMLSTIPEDYKKVVDGLKGKDISVLVNNTMKGSTEGLLTLSFEHI
jgi:short-subunit dehydrogenase